MFSRFFHAASAGLLAVAFFSSIAFAGAPLADRLPADATFYVGWVGTSKLGPAYEQSHTKALIDRTDFKALMTQVWPQLLMKIQKEDPDAAGKIGQAEQLLEQVLVYPTAFYLGKADPDAPVPPLALVCDAGDEQHAAPIAAKLNELFAGKTPFPIRQQGGLVMLATPSVADAIIAAAAPRLSSVAPFIAALKQASPGRNDPALVVYGDVGKLMADVAAPPEADWPKLRDALHLADMGPVMLTAGFDQGDWTVGAYLNMAPTMQRPQPLDDATLKLIPQTAALAGAGHMNMVQMYDLLHDMIGGIIGRDMQGIDAAINQINTQLKLNLRDDFFGSFGDQWAFYCDRGVGGTSMLGLVVVNSLRDEAKFKQALPNLIMMANAILGMAMHNQEVHVSIATTVADGTTLYYWAIPVVAPTMAVHNGRLFMALQPQTVMAAIRTADAKGPSILDNRDFVRLHRACGNQPVESFRYFDLPQTFSSGYQMMLMMTRIYLGLGDMFGVQTPALFLPAADQVMPHVSPSAMFTWTDDAGWHMRSRSPFPGASVLGTDQNVMVSQYALGLGILLPALGRAREVANRAVSGANLNGLFKACYIYSVAHNDAFPTDLAELVTDGSISYQTLLHPTEKERRRTAPPIMADGKPNTAAVSAWIKANTSYVYLGGNANMKPDDIMAYEKPDPAWATEGISIAYGDGHVAWVAWRDVNEEFKRAGKTPPTPPQGGRSDRASPVSSGKSWYYDTVTNDYFTAAADQFPPITSPRGNPAVRAHFFSCGDCDQAGDRFVGFYDKYTDEAKAKLEAARDNPNADQMGIEQYYENGVRYSVDGKNWFGPSNAAYQDALVKKLDCPNGGRAKYCRVK